MGTATETDFLQAIHDSPEEFARHILGVPCFRDGEAFTGDQRDVFEAVCAHSRVAVYSAHGVGKTYSLAVIALWWLHTRIPSIIVTTAGTYQQLEKVLWAEIRNLHQQSAVQLGSDLMPSAPGIVIGPKHYAEAVSVDKPTAMLGRHSKHLLALIDEGEGVEPEIFDAVDRLQPEKTVVIGNPIQPEGIFYDLCSGAPDWHSVRIDGRNHPNVVHDEILVPGAINRQWIRQIIHKYGEESPEYRSMVCGEFPSHSHQSLIWLSWVEAAQARDLATDNAICIGVDVARFGDDESVAVVMDGPKVVDVRTWRHVDTMELANAILELRRQWPQQSNTKVVIDTVGVGSGVADRLYEAGIVTGKHRYR